MHFSEILTPAAVRPLAGASSKKRLFHEIGDLVESAYGLASQDICNALLARESLGPTGVGHGVALPHARLPDLRHVVGAFVLLDRPVEFEAVDRIPVDIAFALFAPEDAGVEHLRALAPVSRTLRDQVIRVKLRNNRDANTLFAILTETQASQAA